MMTLRTIPEVDRRQTKLGPMPAGQYDFHVLHLLKRLIHDIERHDPIEREEFIVLLRFLFADHPELKPHDWDDV